MKGLASSLHGKGKHIYRCISPLEICPKAPLKIKKKNGANELARLCHGLDQETKGMISIAATLEERYKKNNQEKQCPEEGKRERTKSFCPCERFSSEVQHRERCFLNVGSSHARTENHHPLPKSLKQTILKYHLLSHLKAVGYVFFSPSIFIYTEFRSRKTNTITLSLIVLKNRQSLVMQRQRFCLFVCYLLPISLCRIK